MRAFLTDSHHQFTTTTRYSVSVRWRKPSSRHRWQINFKCHLNFNLTWRSRAMSVKEVCVGGDTPQQQVLVDGTVCLVDHFRCCRLNHSLSISSTLFAVASADTVNAIDEVRAQNTLQCPFIAFTIKKSTFLPFPGTIQSPEQACRLYLP